MPLLFMISLRNLFRQKRRNIMLGIAIAFGVMILVIANSFASGISDIMFNKIVSFAAGQVSINVKEGRGNDIQIFRDKERLLKIVEANLTDVTDYDEAAGVFLRAIGNGKSDNLVMVGIDMTKKYTKEQMDEFNDSFLMVEGKFSDLNDRQYYNPVIITKEKAEALNLKMHDVFNVRFRNIYGQNQSAKLTVAGIMSNSNIFMQGLLFISILDIRTLMGYKAHETASIHLTVKNARENAVKVADRLYKALEPKEAFIYADADFRQKTQKATLLPFMQDDDSKKLISGHFSLQSGNMENVLSKDGLMISDKLAKQLGISVGDKIHFTYQQKFEKEKAVFSPKVKGIFKATEQTGEATVYIQESLFYKQYTEFLPDQQAFINLAFLPNPGASFYKALGKEWVLLNRSATTEEWRKKMNEVARLKIKAPTIDVTSMYETASAILNLEYALNTITIVGVIVLFFIILIGVVNTLRMTIKERTREIGTIRAIGMQQKDVQKIFVLETALLTFFSALAGTLLAFIVMWLMSLFSFNVIDNPLGILLVKQHLYFLPKAGVIIAIIAVIILLAVMTSFFPAYKASKKSAAEALRHYE